MNEPVALDSAWISANPLPVHGGGTTKDSRGHVVVIGGGRSVPGALRLTVEAALGAGAGKVQFATIASAAMLLGVMIPEAGAIGTAETPDGEIAAGANAELEKALSRCDVAIVGPGMASSEAAAPVLRQVLGSAPEVTLLVDAVAIAGARELRDALAAFGGALIFTPHHGEMAGLLGRDVDTVRAAPAEAARAAAESYGATIVLKGSDTVISTPDGRMLHYGGGGVGLATSGSGDVLAGAIAGLASRGADPLVAAAWGVWLHGQAGRRLATSPGPIGFLARALPGEFPSLLPQ